VRQELMSQLDETPDARRIVAAMAERTRGIETSSG
jgi:hypothetical protein